MSSPGPGASDGRNNTGAVRLQGSGSVVAQGTSDCIGRSPLFVTPVASQMSMGPVASQMSLASNVGGSGASTPTDAARSENLVQRLSRQVERLDAESKKKEQEKQELKGLLRERDAKLLRMEGDVERLQGELTESVDVAILKDLRARVHTLQEDVRCRDVELRERSEHIARLQRQVGATSATGSALSFLNDLIGAKDKYTKEAQQAKEEAEHVKRRMEQVSRQNEEKEHMIRQLEDARRSLSGKAQQDGQEAQHLREKVKNLEGMLEAQLHSVMQELVDATHRNEELAADNSNIHEQLTCAREDAQQLARKAEHLARTVETLREEGDAGDAAARAELHALLERVVALEESMLAAQARALLLKDELESSKSLATTLNAVSACVSVCL